MVFGIRAIAQHCLLPVKYTSFSRTGEILITFELLKKNCSQIKKGNMKDEMVYPALPEKIIHSSDALVL